METFELNYFLSVARFENIHRAAEHAAVSPGSLSKAIGRLEDELGAKLFARQGRNIALTEQGRVLQVRAAEIIRLEQAARLEIQGKTGQLNVVMAGSENVLGGLAFDVIARIRKKFHRSSFEFVSVSDEEALRMVGRGAAHLGLVTSSVPKTLKSVSLKSCKFQTAVGNGHPLFVMAKAHKNITVERLLEHSFVCPSRGLLGRIQNEQSADGWRDDIFPRRIVFVTSSLKLIESIVMSGMGVAYLPDYLVAKMGAQVVKVSGCPYSCEQDIRLVAHRPENFGWMNVLF